MVPHVPGLVGLDVAVGAARACVCRQHVWGGGTCVRVQAYVWGGGTCVRVQDCREEARGGGQGRRHGEEGALASKG